MKIAGPLPRNYPANTNQRFSEIGGPRQASPGHQPPAQPLARPELRQYRYMTLPRSTGTFRDNRENPAAAPYESKENYARAEFNGMAYRIVAKDVQARGTPITFINGSNNSPKTAAQRGAELSGITGRPVDLIYNAGDRKVAHEKTISHFTAVASRVFDQRDPPRLNADEETQRQIRRSTYIVQVLAHAALTNQGTHWIKNNVLHNPPAAVTAASMILAQLRSTEKAQAPVRVAAHSQGLAVLSEALNKVNSVLTATHGAAHAKRMMARIQVLALGGAANAQDFARLNVTNYTSVFHDTDLVTRYFGDNRGNLLRGNPVALATVLRNMIDPRQDMQHRNYLATGAEGRYAAVVADPMVANQIRAWMQPQNRFNNAAKLIGLPDFNP
jgi:hypothetical protein